MSVASRRLRRSILCPLFGSIICKRMESSVPVQGRRLTFDTASAWAVALTLGLAAVLFIPSANVPLVYAKVSLLALGALVALVLFILGRLTRGSIIVPPL